MTDQNATPVPQPITPPPPQNHISLERLLSNSRYLLLIAVVGAFIAAAILIIYAGLNTLYVIWNLITAGNFSDDTTRHLSLTCIEIVDQFLLGAALYIVALGLYQLFINRQIDLPSWLVVRTLDDLKARLLSITIVLLAVLFLGYVAVWDGTGNIQGLGVAIALVIAAVTLLLRWGPHGAGNGE